MATVKVKFNRLPQAQNVLEQGISTAITKFLGDVEANADAVTPVLTGHLKNDKETVVDGMQGKIHWKADYALYVHEGTRYQSSQPFAQDGFDKALPSLADAFNGMEGDF